LNPKTFDLLLYLAEHPHQLVTKEELLAAVWPGAFVEESNLTQHIFLLRKALAGSKPDGRAVVTVPGKGYQFTAAVERVPLELRMQAAGDLVMHSVQTVTRVVVEEESDDGMPAPAALPAARRRPDLILWAIAAAIVLCGMAAAAPGARRAYRPGAFGLREHDR
jgi:DNA-binding winged helix-turn-helix (wHTH) protein